ncbi:preprotein translocase subunit SecA [Desulfurispirillum indicum]|uniref:Protein translocase subunit SecA n=1 Tax=Desulfurispirillum indicum (strain ATCC BAA-1389 / DSM 22839 / S5) TaxID=653733 RepID=E6W090_DESIS|nr:preprotein translocase subunit SecA [Desulfurispirillum indicum]ADU65216.1 preprotein translocase, SecA subunit [Desulfurispirillum indicum S5]UCZ57106.1 preprotein translocase subunit SecA [Desulfurispirillum indicum]
MLKYLAKKIVGTKNERELKKIRPLVDKVNALEASTQALSDDELKAKTIEFRERYAAGESLDDLMPEAFAVVREASVRTTGMRHFDVQLIGGAVLHAGNIAEMKTGEGKTLVATLPVYLNALSGKGVHVITVNDYLAKRDSEWMGKIYRFLGLEVGVIVHGLTDEERKAAYGADITYGTNNELGFDYLRDNMKFRIEDYVQREHNFAIVDEVDSILIDEARTPLIISGPAEVSTDDYYRADKVVRQLQEGEHFNIDEKSRNTVLTEPGVKQAEALLGIENLYDVSNMKLLHHVNQSLKAHHNYQRDIHYMVDEDGKVVIVDEFTGRVLEGRRYSDGLHQAIEAKEQVPIERENQTLATITYQNYFRLYSKLAGMTGTADTEAAEFKKIYDLEVAVIPTNVPMQRIDNTDKVYRTKDEKFAAVIEEIREAHQKGQPCLVGTISVESSEYLSNLLKKAKIKHNVLNAKNHAHEATIIADAGKQGAVTIATNMAGRGTDIKLGEGVLELGGLHIVGTERHESRRIDNQLRGRSGRQGDPGSSQFFLSLEDDLMRIFGGDRIKNLMDRFGMQEGEPIEHTLVNRAIENAQKKVENYHFEVRKHLLEYDDVMNQQRQIIYTYRREILGGEGVDGMVEERIDQILHDIFQLSIPAVGYTQDVKQEELSESFRYYFSFAPDFGRFDDTAKVTEVREGLRAQVFEVLHRKEEEIGKERFFALKRYFLLNIIDTAWKDNLLSMDRLKEGIGLRSYGQKNPLTEYKREAFELFENMMSRIKEETVVILFKVEIAKEEEPPSLQDAASVPEARNRAERRRQQKKAQKSTPAANALCPCGSGVKYKLCCGAN